MANEKSSLRPHRVEGKSTATMANDKSSLRPQRVEGKPTTIKTNDKGSLRPHHVDEGESEQSGNRRETTRCRHWQGALIAALLLAASAVRALKNTVKELKDALIVEVEKREALEVIVNNIEKSRSEEFDDEVDSGLFYSSKDVLALKNTVKALNDTLIVEAEKREALEAIVNNIEKGESSGALLEDRVATLEARQPPPCTGLSPDPSNWRQYNSNTVVLDVDASRCGYPVGSRPKYFTALTGQASFLAIGATSIYPPYDISDPAKMHEAFRIWLRLPEGNFSIAQVRERNWRVQWVAYLE